MNYINHTIIQQLHLERKDNAHKGDHGKILCIGGSEDYTGAPYFSAMASARLGADMVGILILHLPRHLLTSFDRATLSASLKPDRLLRPILRI